jgi:hypothetical protein
MDNYFYIVEKKEKIEEVIKKKILIVTFPSDKGVKNRIHNMFIAIDRNI